MEIQEFQQKYLPLLIKYKLPLILGLVGLIFLGYGLIASSANNSKQDDFVFENEKEDVSQIVIDIEGGVLKPGVYSLPKAARIQDALIAAGGLSVDANREWVAKNINLALPLKDGIKIYIPLQSESLKASSNNLVLGSMENNVININSASQKELETLPGIGPVTAQKIIDQRPYNAVEELLEKKVVSRSVLEKIREKITIY